MVLRDEACIVALVVLASCRFDLPVSGTDATVDSPPPNCAMKCGISRDVSCCEVPGGMFHRSYDGAGFNDMGYPAVVSTFMLDKYEVTVGRFRAFVNAGMGTQLNPPVNGAGVHPNLAGSGWDSAWNTSLATSTDALKASVKCDATYQTWTDIPGGNEHKPMNCVDWYEATAFCIWDGGYLPTETEWNYAASGGSEQRVFPWSNPASSSTIDCTYANYRVDAPAGTYCVNSTSGGANEVGSESPKGDGKWGHSDLAGNMFEWTLDWFSFSSMFPLPCDDCANLIPSTSRTLRAGGFRGDALRLRAANRDYVGPTFIDVDVGLRCARSP